MELSEIREQAARAAEEVCAAAKLRVGDLFVVGCSSSEVCGEKIGTHSSVEVAEAVFEGIYSVIEKHGLFLAAQCCEHLNRALIVERAAAEKFGLDEVNVIPQPKAGGSFGRTIRPSSSTLRTIPVDFMLKHSFNFISFSISSIHDPSKDFASKRGTAWYAERAVGRISCPRVCLRSDDGAAV